MSLLHPILLLLALARLLELTIAGRNTRRLMAAVAVEAGQNHYPLIVALVFGLANALVIGWRIRIEDQLLAPRRQ